MADFPENSVWSEGIRGIEETDKVLDTVINIPFKQLVDRTQWLKDNGGVGSALDHLSESTSVTDLQDATFYVVEGDIEIDLEDVSGVGLGSEYHFFIKEGSVSFNNAEMVLGAIDYGAIVGEGSAGTLKNIESGESMWVLFGDVSM